jgi:transcriptional regulator with XRE-family HTH domain
LNKLREYRIKAGLTITALAKEADVAPKTVKRAESEKTSPRDETLYRILNALNKLAKKEHTFEGTFGRKFGG